MSASFVLAAVLLLHDGSSMIQEKPLTVPNGVQHTESSSDMYSKQDKIHTVKKLDLTYSIEDGGPAPASRVATITCTSPCRGKKHTGHSQCDKSCDSPCFVAKHIERAYVSLNPDTLDLRANSYSEPEPSNLVPISPTLIRSAVEKVVASQGYESLERSAPGHWAKPCSSTTRKYGYRRYNLRAKGTITATYDKPSDKWTDTEQVDAIVAFIDLPDYTRMLSEVNSVSCLCSVPYTSIDPPTETIQPGTNMGPGIVFNPPGTDGWFPMDPNDPGPGIVYGGNDLNKIDFGIGQLPPEGFQVLIPPGQIFKPDDGDVQAMVSLVRTLIKIPGKNEVVGLPGSRASSFMGAIPGQTVIPLGSIRVACTEMRKHEPNSKVRFKPSGIFDPVLMKIAQVADGERFRGPWDQARVWIHTDNATLEEVNKILIPGPNVGSYARALQQAEECGVDLIEGKSKRCLTPDLVLGATAPPSIIGWLINRLSLANPRGTASFIRSNFAKFAQEGKPNDAASLGYLAALVDGLNESYSSELKAIVPEFIQKAIPATMTDDVLKQTRYQAEIAKALKKHSPQTARN